MERGPCISGYVVGGQARGGDSGRYHCGCASDKYGGDCRGDGGDRVCGGHTLQGLRKRNYRVPVGQFHMLGGDRRYYHQRKFHRTRYTQHSHDQADFFRLDGAARLLVEDFLRPPTEVPDLRLVLLPPADFLPEGRDSELTDFLVGGSLARFGGRISRSVVILVHPSSLTLVS